MWTERHFKVVWDFQPAWVYFSCKCALSHRLMFGLPQHTIFSAVGWDNNNVPYRIDLMNHIVHLNTVNRIFRNWIITFLKIKHLPDFRKPRFGEARTIWFDPYCPSKQFWMVFLKGCNSWIQLLFCFFLEHRLKTLNKEQYDLNHVAW